jgi:hypothetical protein
MPTYARRQIVREDQVGVYHRNARYVRKAFLRGIDPYTRHDYSHRKLNRSNWVETVRRFCRMFKQAAGRSSSLVDAAARCSRRWFQGKAAA